MTNYRVTLTAADAAQLRFPVADWAAWDALVDEHDQPGSRWAAGLLERQAKDGSWKHAGEWGRVPEPQAELTDAERIAARIQREREANAAHAAHLEREDRREIRRGYYLRTGK